MDDRANVLVKSGSEQVCLYTHWDGDELPVILQKAMKRGEDRWDDFQFLTRIIFCEMIPQECFKELTGYGITQIPYDGENRIITVNVDDQTVQICGKTPVSFLDYTAIEARW